MRKCILTVLAIVALTPSPALSQLRVSDWGIGAHAASNLSENPPDMVRVGLQAGYRVSGLFGLYPSVALMTDRANWQASLHLRLDPTPANPAMPFYVGIGGSVIEWGPSTRRFYDVLLAGFEAHIGRVLPFMEVQLLDPIHRLSNGRGDFGVQAHIGFLLNMAR